MTDGTSTPSEGSNMLTTDTLTIRCEEGYDTGYVAGGVAGSYTCGEVAGGVVTCYKKCPVPTLQDDNQVYS